MKKVSILLISLALAVSPAAFAQQESGAASGGAAGAGAGAAAGAATAGLTVGVVAAAAAAVAAVAAATAKKDDPVYTTTGTGTNTSRVCVAHC